MHTKPRDVEVGVTFLPTEHGGRSRGMYSGYRPQFYYGSHDWDSVFSFPEYEESQEVPGRGASGSVSQLTELQ